MLLGRRAGRGSPTRRPRARLGIGMVFQHFSLFEAMTVLENIALGVDDAGDMRALASAHRRGARTPTACRSIPRREVHTLSVGERQRIEIVRCLLQNPKLLIMDEPTSVLTPQEVERLFETLRQLAAEGCSILYISHKLRRDQGAVRHARRSCAAASVVGDLRSQGRDRAQHGAADDRQPSSRTVARRAGERARRAAAERCDGLEPAGRASRSAPTLRGRRVRGPRAARSSASPASPATARTSCSRRSRASAWSRGADAVQHRRPAGRAHRRRRRARGLGLALRARGAQRPRAPCPTCRWSRTPC